LTTSPSPRIWLVIGDKLGDNAQVEIITEALGMPYEIRRVLPKQEYVIGKPRFKPSLYHLDLDRSDKLEPPWPDVILTIGRRPSMAALWIQKKSGGQSKIILFGRPKRWIRRFGLVIVPSQYPMPESPNVLHLDLPLMRSNEAAISEASNRWRGHFEELPHPITALLVGGQTKPFRFDVAVAEELLELAKRTGNGGTLYVTTSRRTPSEVTDALQDKLPENATLYRWSPDNLDNPYLALLGLADRFIVTGDSMSMMVEVARLGKPLAIFPLPLQGGKLGRMIGGLTERLNRSSPLRSVIHRLQQLGILGYQRDLTAVHRSLISKGLAVPLGEPFRSGNHAAPDDVALVVSRIKALLAEIA